MCILKSQHESFTLVASLVWFSQVLVSNVNLWDIHKEEVTSRVTWKNPVRSREKTLLGHAL